MSGQCPFSRRRFLAAVGGFGLLAAKAGLGSGIAQAAGSAGATGLQVGENDIEPFWGPRQAGILTPQQGHTYFATFDLIAADRIDIVEMLRAWTEASARMSRGQLAAPIEADPKKPAGDSGEAAGLAPSRLTLTFGFGPGLFVKNGQDRYGLAAHRPAALVDLPRFNGDQLIEGKTGGDLSVQACAEDPQVAFHAVRQLGRLASGAAQIRWAQAGFLPDARDTPRNLMGFKDGTGNPKELGREKVVWAGPDGPEWMRGGSYLVVRRIRMALEHWDGTETGFQERVIGRRKDSGAPLGMRNEFDELDLEATDKDGNLVIPDNAHVRLGAAAVNDGAQILRRGYSYNDGVNFISERWPPWRQGVEYDAGLLFFAYQRDPRSGFMRIFESMSKLDALNQFVTHNGSGIFACPPGASAGQFIGQRLFAASS